MYLQDSCGCASAPASSEGERPHREESSCSVQSAGCRTPTAPGSARGAARRCPPREIRAQTVRGGVAPQPGSQSAPTYQTPVTIPGSAAQPTPHRQSQHPKPHRSKKPLVIGIAAAVVVAVAAVVVLVVLPAVNPRPFKGTLALTEDSGGESSTYFHLNLKGDSAHVGADMLSTSGGDQDVRVSGTERRGDVMVYNLDPSSSDYWRDVQSLQAFAPVGASAEKPYGRWGLVFYKDSSSGPELYAVNLVLNEDGTGRLDVVSAETKADKSEASSVDDLMWANPLADGYDPSVLKEHGENYTYDFAYAMDFTWTGDPAHVTIRIPNFAGEGYEEELTLSINESK